MNLFSPAEIAANYAEAGVKKSSLPISKMLLLGVLAGMLIAFPSCVTNMASYGLDNNSTIRAISGLLFAFGLGMVILIGAELFTGNTLICISVLEKKVRVGVMLRNWVFVYIGNFIGSMLVAVLCAKFGWLSASGNLLATYAMKVALGKMTMPFQNAFFMGFLCNVLVTIGVLLSLGAKDTAGRFIGAWAPVMFFVTCGFNHSIADMTYCAHGPVRQDGERLCRNRSVTGYGSERSDMGQLLPGQHAARDAGQHSGRIVRRLYHVVRLFAEDKITNDHHNLRLCRRL